MGLLFNHPASSHTRLESILSTWTSVSDSASRYLRMSIATSSTSDCINTCLELNSHHRAPYSKMQKTK
ncbi:hypothetical protein Hanom_Chr04g00360661 [Helianthus anomalus]